MEILKVTLKTSTDYVCKELITHIFTTIILCITLVVPNKFLSHPNSITIYIFKGTSEITYLNKIFKLDVNDKTLDSNRNLEYMSIKRNTHIIMHEFFVLTHIQSEICIRIQVHIIFKLRKAKSMLKNPNINLFKTGFEFEFCRQAFKISSGTSNATLH